MATHHKTERKVTVKIYRHQRNPNVSDVNTSKESQDSKMKIVRSVGMKHPPTPPPPPPHTHTFTVAQLIMVRYLNECNFHL